MEPNTQDILRRLASLEIRDAQTAQDIGGLKARVEIILWFQGAQLLAIIGLLVRVFLGGDV